MHDTPIGQFVMNVAGYGHKLVMGHSQLIAVHLRPVKITFSVEFIIYVDDGIGIFVITVSGDEIIAWVHELGMNAIELGIKLNVEKLCITPKTVTILGDVYESGKYHMTDKYRQQCINVPEPTNMKENKSIFAMFNYLNEKVYDMAGQLEPLAQKLSKKAPFQWTQKDRLAFQSIKEAIEHAGFLCTPSEDGRFLLVGDGSKYAFCVILLQESFDNESGKLVYKIIAFYSRRYPKAIMPKPIGTKELYHCVHGAGYFKEYTFRGEYDQVTDHKNIIYWTRAENQLFRMSEPNRSLIIEMASRAIRFRWCPGNLIDFADYGSRIGFQGKIAKLIRESEAQRDKLNQLKKRLEKISMKEYLRYFGDFDILEIQSRLNLNLVPVPSDDQIERINLERALNCLYSIGHGNENALNYGFRVIDSLTHEMKMGALMADRAFHVMVKKWHRDYYLNEKMKMQKANWITLNASGLDFDVETRLQALKKHELLNNISIIDINNIQNGNQQKLIYNYLNRSKSTFLNKKPRSILKRGHFLDEKNIKDEIGDLESRLKDAQLNMKRNQELLRELANSKTLLHSIDKKYYSFAVETRAMKRMKKLNSKLSKASLENFGKKRKMAKKSVEKDENHVESEEHLKSLKQEKRQRKQRKKKLDQEKEETKKEPKPVRRSKRIALQRLKRMEDGLDEKDDIKYGTSEFESVLDHIPTDGTFNPITFKESWQLMTDQSIVFEDISDEKMKQAQQFSEICKILFDVLLNQKMDEFNELNYNSNKFWIDGINKDLMKIEDNILYYNIMKNQNSDALWVIIVPELLRLKVIKYFHCKQHISHPGADAIYPILKKSYYWPCMYEDLRFACSSCPICQTSSGNIARASMEPWLPQYSGELIVADYGGPYLNLFLILYLQDVYTGYLVMEMVNLCSAAVTCMIIMERWIPRQGIPMQILSDAGTAFKNNLNEAFYDICGIKSLYSTERYHQASGKIENTIKQINLQFRKCNINLDGQLNDWNQKHESFRMIKSLLKGIEFQYNCSNQTSVGFSPFEMDRGFNPNQIIDVQKALKNVKKYCKDGKVMKVKSALEVLQYLHELIKYNRDRADLKRMDYIYRYKHAFEHGSLSNENHNRNKLENYKIGDKVMFYIGDMNGHTQQWNARFSGPFDVIKVFPGTLTVKNDEIGLQFDCAKGMIKRWIDGGNWMKELDYEKFILAKNKHKLKNKKKVNFE